MTCKNDAQTEFIHEQFPFKSLEMTIDSIVATRLVRKCAGEIFVNQRFFVEISSLALLFFDNFLLLIPVCEHNCLILWDAYAVLSLTLQSDRCKRGDFLKRKECT